jgi:hypothetical protein
MSKNTTGLTTEEGIRQLAIGYLNDIHDVDVMTVAALFLGSLKVYIDKPASKPVKKPARKLRKVGVR